MHDIPSSPCVPASRGPGEGSSPSTPPRCQGLRGALTAPEWRPLGVCEVEAQPPPARGPLSSCGSQDKALQGVGTAEAAWRVRVPDAGPGREPQTGLRRHCRGRCRNPELAPRRVAGAVGRRHSLPSSWVRPRHTPPLRGSEEPWGGGGSPRRSAPCWTLSLASLTGTGSGPATENSLSLWDSTSSSVKWVVRKGDPAGHWMSDPRPVGRGRFPSGGVARCAEPEV